MTDITTLIDLLTRGGLMTALILALWGGMKGWYVWKNVHEAAIKAVQTLLDESKVESDKRAEDARTESDRRIAELTKDRDYWREQAIRVALATGRITDVLEATKETK